MQFVARQDVARVRDSSGAGGVAKQWSAWRGTTDSPTALVAGTPL